MKRSASFPFLFASSTAAISIFFAGGLASCTHDFGQFENGQEGGEDGSSGGSDGGGGIDSSCTPDASCTTNAKTCGTNCQTTETQCESGCSTGGSGRNCRSNCQSQQTTCNNQCVATCVQCAGCNAQSTCENAL